MNPRKPIRRVSTGRAAQLREYSKVKRKWWPTVRGTTCPVMQRIFCIHINVDPWPHHMAGRNGRLLTYVPSWMACSQQGHDWIKQYPEAARRNGWIAPVGVWNDYQKAVEHYESLTH